MKNMLLEFFDCKIIAESYSTSFTDVNHVTWKALFKDAPFVICGDSFLPNDVVKIPSAVARNIYSTAKTRLNAQLRTRFDFIVQWSRCAVGYSYEYSKIVDDKLF